MGTTWRLAIVGLAVLCTTIPCTSAVQPYLASPGNNTILAFLDVHRSYHDNGTCSDPNWEAFELAYSLVLSRGQNDTTGIEVYDTCGSADRVGAVLRQRLLPDGCGNVSWLVVAGVMSHSIPDVSDVIAGFIRVTGIIYVDVWSVPDDSMMALPSQHLVATVASREISAALALLLEEVKWLYVTTITDDHPVSVFEHATFLQEARTRGICVQYSQTPSSASQLDYSTVRTPGIVIFTQNINTTKVVLNSISKNISVIIVTHDRLYSKFTVIRNGIILTDSYNDIDSPTGLFMETLWNSTYKDDMVSAYFISNHNCSMNETTNEITCPDVEGMDVASRRTVDLLHNVASLLTTFTDVMLESNCTTFSVHDCAALSDLLIDQFPASLPFLGLDSNELVTKPPYGISLEWISNASTIQRSEFTTSGSSSLVPNVTSWIVSSSGNFPTSECTGWCPACSPCDGHLAFTDNFYHLPGDILIAGLFPVRLKGDGPFTCDQFSVSKHTDIHMEAFMFALQTAQQRYPGLLPGTDIGTLLLDTCSDIDRARRAILNFESCQYVFESEGNSWKPSPRIVPAYVLPVDEGTHGMDNDFGRLFKLAVNVDDGGSIHARGETVYDATLFNHQSLVSLLESVNWYYVGVITSSGFQNNLLDAFSEYGMSKNICIAYHAKISTDSADIEHGIEVIRRSAANTVILIATTDELDVWFKTLTFHPIYRTWILVESRTHWLDLQHITIPLGSLVIQRNGKDNVAFNEHYQAVVAGTANPATPWTEPFKRAINNCPLCDYSRQTAEVWMKSSDIIKAVDMTLHAIHGAHQTLCPGDLGLCQAFWTNVTRVTSDELDSIRFVYQEETIQLSPRGQMLENYVISNFQTAGFVQIGEWQDESLTLRKENIKSYGSNGAPLSRLTDSHCYSSCVCINNNTVGDQTTQSPVTQLDPEMGYIASSGKFTTELWSIIVVVVSGTGSLGTILLMLYIMCKVCSGALIRRYLVLGLLLLLAMMCLYLSVLPFLFSPSETVCGMRFFAHGFSYAFCFSIILTKMLTLRDYKYIGLGGEISRMNQFLSVFFITGVQIAIGVQWWVLRTPVLFVTTVIERTDTADVEVTYYACDFDRKDFIAYHVYVMLLVVICCIYAIGIRKEEKNMKEARLLLVCSWFCMAVWIAMIVTLLLLSWDFLEAICAVGILASALAMTVIIYLPKLTAIASLKYEFTDSMGKKDGGYHIDPDFRFERPYSLPGTISSSVTDKTLTYPRSLATFDTSLSY